MKSHLSRGVYEGAWSLLHVPSVPQPHGKPCSGRLQAGLRVMLTSVSLDTGKGMHPQKNIGSTYVSIYYSIIFTQELLMGIVHKQKITGFSPSQVLTRDWQKHINGEWL